MKSLNLLLIVSSLFLTVNSAFAQAPNSPSNANIRVISGTESIISWQDNSNNEDGFIIYDDKSKSVLGAVEANVESVRITGLTLGSRIQYSIFAYSGQNFEQVNPNPATTPEVIVSADKVTRYGYQVTIGQPFSAKFYTDEFALQSSANISGLPNWATFSETTRTVSGTPNTEGVHSLDIVVEFSNGFQLIETVLLRVVAGPVLTTASSNLKFYPNTDSESIDLSLYFEDPDCSRAARLNFNVGTVDIVLYENATPETVANFLQYASENSNTGQSLYNGSIIHRSVPGFIIQGGGYRPTGGISFESVPDFGPVINEPGLENVRGTLSMAKLGGNPNSATNEWFVNLRDNRSNLDSQNGGFTVFGRVAGNGMDVVDSVASLPKGNYPSITVDGFLRSGLMTDCPMNVTTSTAPVNMEQDKLVVLETAVEIDPLAYSIVSNSDPLVVEATLNNGILQIIPLKLGSCTLKIRATDLDDNQIERDITIEIAGWTFDDWSNTQGLASGENGLLDDADGDQLTNFIEYNLFGDPTSATRSLTEVQQVSHGTLVTQDYLAIKFSTLNGVEDAIISVETINRLSSDAIWTEIWNSSLDPSAAQVHSVDVKADHTDWVIRDNQPIGSDESRFIRVRVDSL